MATAEKQAKRNGAMARYLRYLGHLETKHAIPKRTKAPLVLDPTVVRIEVVDMPGPEAFPEHFEFR